MGLISAALNAASGVAADQWKEYFYCDALDANTIMVRGQKRGRSNNGSDNIISSGSVIAVADGQCMIIVEQGKIAELCAEPGEFVYDASTEPSIFSGSLGEGIGQVFAQIGKRFTFGGVAPKDQRVYYFNTKEITGNKYGTPSPVPFRVVAQRAGIDIDIGIRCFGEYSYRVANPILFYTNVSGNVSGAYTRDMLDNQLKTELLTALQPAFAKISDQGIRYSSLPGHTNEIADALNDVLSNKWRDLRGLEIVAFGVSSVKASEEDEQMIKELQRNAAFRDPNMAAAHLVGAQAAAMQDAANNANGAAMGSQPQTPAAPAAPAADTWTCPGCGKKAFGKFCTECGTKKPVDGWTCPSCGKVNKGKFCAECGTKKPADAPVYKCEKCGWEPEDPAHPPKFCPECGDPFTEEDIVK